MSCQNILSLVYYVLELGVNCEIKKKAYTTYSKKFLFKWQHCLQRRHRRGINELPPPPVVRKRNGCSTSVIKYTGAKDSVFNEFDDPGKVGKAYSLLLSTARHSTSDSAGRALIWLLCS